MFPASQFNGESELGSVRRERTARQEAERDHAGDPGEEGVSRE